MNILIQKKILCVDDSNGVGKALASFFIARKCQVDKVANITQALLLLEKKTYDLILYSDHVVDMPEVHFLRIVRKRFPGTINILITDNVKDALPAECPATAVDLILGRPLGGAALEERLAEWLVEHKKGLGEVAAARQTAGQEIDQETGGKSMETRQRIRALGEEFVEEDTQKDKYLTFHLAGEDFGIEIRYVTEIIGIQAITQVPDMPDFVRGVINLRGKVIPVMDVRTRFKLEARDYDARTCIIVVDINENLVGLVVDEVREVADIPAAQVEPPPRTGNSAGSSYIQGMGKLNNEVKIILNVGRLLYEEELAKLDAA